MTSLLEVFKNGPDKLRDGRGMLGHALGHGLDHLWRSLPFL